MPVYLFFRDIGFYPVELMDDKDALANVECNPGTLKVEDATGRVVWEPKIEKVN